jgi:hypothetical protein
VCKSWAGGADHAIGSSPASHRGRFVQRHGRLVKLRSSLPRRLHILVAQTLAPRGTFMSAFRAASLTGLLLTLASGAAAQSLSASDSPDSERLPVEISTFLSVGDRDASGTGVTARIPIRARLSFEAEAAWRLEAVSGIGGSGNLVLDLRRPGRVTPYVIGGVGIDRYAVGNAVPHGGPDLHLASALSVSGGGGVRIPINAHWGMRADGRIGEDIGRGPTRWRVFYGVTANVGGGSD